MKTFYQAIATVALSVAALGAQAAPLEYTKLSGTTFDVYYKPNSLYSATMSGNKLQLSLNDFTVAPYNFELGKDLDSSFYFVAHDGGTIASSYKQSFTGSFGFDWQAYWEESLQVGLFSTMFTGNPDDDTYNQVGSAGNYVNIHPWNSPSGSLDSAHLDRFDGAFFDVFNTDDGRSYKELGLDFQARLKAVTSPSGFPLYAQFDTISFELFTIADAPADVPEPMSLALFAAGALALASRRRSGRKGN